MRMKVEQMNSRRGSKRERNDWVDYAPVASSSSEELSVWELDHEFYMQASKQMKREEEQVVEVEEIKEEEIKPTKKILGWILEEYQRSLSVRKSTVSHQVRKFEPTQKDSYKCGNCGYKTEMREKLDTHWKFGCEVMQVEEKHGKPEAYQCAGCGVREENYSLIKRHMYYECQGLQKTNLKAY